MHDIKWRSGFLCYIVFGVNMDFHMVSPLLLSFMSISRLMIVSYPLDSKFKESTYVFEVFVFSIYFNCNCVCCDNNHGTDCP